MIKNRVLFFVRIYFCNEYGKNKLKNNYYFKYQPASSGRSIANDKWLKPF